MLKSKVKAYIELSDINRQEVRRVMKVSENTLSNWCTGKNHPSLENVFKLSRLLGVTVEDLYEYKEDNK